LDNKYVQNLEIPILILLNKIDLLIDDERIKKVYDNLEYKKIYNKNFTVIELSALKGYIRVILGLILKNLLAGYFML
jgi:predicted GTPase